MTNSPTVTRLPGLVLTDHEFDLPVDHARPDGPRLTVYAREAAAPDGRDRPWLLFLQGGPGSAAPRPADAGGWLGRAVRDFRVLLLDQRGTGRSAPATRQTLAGMSTGEQAAHLAHFRADAIVEDAEAIRRALCGDGEPWSLLGQSFGGFCVATYLSRYPEAVREAFVTGGLPPLTATAEEVYRATFPRVAERNERYYARYPGDAEVVRRLLGAVRAGGVVLPDGDPLTEARLRLLGLRMGFRTGLEQVHYLLEQAFVPGTDTLSDAFLHGIAPLTGFATNPLYAVLHEPVYAGPGTPSRWAADRVLAEFDAFAGDDPVYLTGEMIFRSFLADQAALRPLAAAADVLAARTDWPALYDVDRLRACRVPVAAIVYHDDIFVDAGYSLATARTLGNCRVWVTNEFEHDGLQDAAVLDRLIAMARGLR